MDLEPLHDGFDKYLVGNDDPEFCCGEGLFFRNDVDIPEGVIARFRMDHARRIKNGEPYFIFDFLAEDISNGINIERKGNWYYLADPDSYSFE